MPRFTLSQESDEEVILVFRRHPSVLLGAWLSGLLLVAAAIALLLVYRESRALWLSLAVLAVVAGFAVVAPIWLWMRQRITVTNRRLTVPQGWRGRLDVPFSRLEGVRAQVTNPRNLAGTLILDDIAGQIPVTQVPKVEAKRELIEQLLWGLGPEVSSP